MGQAGTSSAGTGLVGDGSVRDGSVGNWSVGNGSVAKKVAADPPSFNWFMYAFICRVIWRNVERVKLDNFFSKKELQSY
jgi:hypothetical protein